MKINRVTTAIVEANFDWTTRLALIASPKQIDPGAANLISATGPQVPVAYQTNDSALRENVPGLSKTPLEKGLGETLEIFQRLHAAGRLLVDLA